MTMRCFTSEAYTGLTRSGSQSNPRQRGVVLVIMLLAIVLIASLLYYVINLGKHVNNRIVAQHSADAAANAQGTWIARQFNTVAMNNVTITRYLAAIPVMDCQTLIAETQYNEYRRLLDGLQESYNPNTGLNTISSGNLTLDGNLASELQQLHNEMMSEQQQLYDVYNQFLQYDIQQDTRYPGNIWNAMANLNEISIACMEALPTMAGLHAADVGRVNMEADNSAGTFVTTIPAIVNTPYRHSKMDDTSLATHFDDFKDPVLDGRLPSYMDHRIINRGPFDTVFGQRSLLYSMFDQTRDPGDKTSPALAMLGSQKFDMLQPSSLFSLFDTGEQLTLKATGSSFSDTTANQVQTTTASNAASSSDVTVNASLTMTDTLVDSIAMSVLTSPFGGGYQNPPSDTSNPSRPGRSPSARVPQAYTTNGIMSRILNSLQSNPNHRRMPFNRHINLFRQNYAQWSKYAARNEIKYLWPENGDNVHNRFAKPAWTTRYPTTLDPDEQVIARTAFLRLQIKSRYRWGDDGFLSTGSYHIQTNFGDNANNQVEMRDPRTSGSLYLIMTRGWWLGDVLDPISLRMDPVEPDDTDTNTNTDENDEEPDNSEFEVTPFVEVIPISSNNRAWLYLDDSLVRPVPNGDTQLGIPPFDADLSGDSMDQHVVNVYQVVIYLGINTNPLYLGLDSHELNPHENSDLSDSQRSALRRENDNTFHSDSQLARAYVNAMDEDEFVAIIPNPFEGLDHDALPGPVILNTTSFNRTDDGGECNAARESVREYQDQRLRFLAYASRQNQAAFWPTKFDRTKPTNRTSAVAQVVIFNNHSFDLWTPMWQSQIEQTANWQGWINKASSDLSSGEHPWSTDSQLTNMINHLQAVTPLAEARLSH
jgi:hypothetical protein